jgi:hypothetical protein
MKMSKKILYTSFLVLTLLLSGCLPLPVQASQPTPNPSTLEAGVVATLIAQITKTAAAGPTITPIVITATPAPIQQPTATLTITPTIIPAIIPCDKGAFVADVTVPDGTIFAAGATFVKTWRLQNVGTCTWTPAYQMVFAGGNSLGAPTSFNIPTFVDPGSTVDISVQMQAPTSAGSFEGFWELMDPNGNTFGVGVSGSVAFDVLITVGSTSTVPFAVQHVLTSVDTTSIANSCPPGHDFKLTANIFTNGPGTVTYVWEFSDGSISDEHSLNFPGAGTQTVSTTFKATATGDYWGRVRIDNPNHQSFDKISFSLNCK